MSTKSKINLFYSVVIPATVIVTTIELFFVLGGELKTSLFWFNLCYTVALEAIFFVYLNLQRFSNDRITGAFYSMKGVWALYYIAAGAATMLIYTTLLLHFLPMRFYISTFIVYTLLWIIVAGLAAKNDVNHSEQTARLQQRGILLGYYADSILQLEKRYTDISSKLGISSTTRGYDCELTRLTMKIKSLSPSLFDLDITLDKLDQIIDNCAEILDAVETNPDADRHSIADKMKRFTDRSIDEIEIIKILTE